MKSSISWSGTQHVGARTRVTLSPSNQRILWVIALSLGIMAPALIFGMPSNLDLSNHFRFALPFYDALRAGHWYPGWLGESNYGYGDASFRFYPPGLYYLLALMRAVTGDWYSGTLLSFSLLSVTGGLGIYFWARTILSETAAVWAAIFYALIPYHVNQFYQALLLAEYAAAVLPFVFAFADKVCTRRRNIDIAGLAISYAILVLTHLPLTIVGSLALLVYVGLRIKKADFWDTLQRLTLAAVLGLTASAFYWMRMVAELPWIGVNTPNPRPVIDYRREFLFATFSPDNLNVWWMNILAILMLLMMAHAIILFTRGAKDDRRKLNHVLVMFAASLTMGAGLSRPLWRVIPPLQQIQFPWRWLTIVSLFASLIAGAAMPFWAGTESGSVRKLRLVLFGIALISLSFTISHTVREAVFLTRPQFNSALEAVRGSESVSQWLPVWTNRTPERVINRVETTDRTVTIDKWEPEMRSFYVTEGQTRQARVRTFFYPLWLATTNGNPALVHPAKDGSLLIDLPAEAASVHLEFHEPKLSRFSRGFSCLGWLGIAAQAAFGLFWRPRMSGNLSGNHPESDKVLSR